MSCCFNWISKARNHPIEPCTELIATACPCPFDNIPTDILVKILGDSGCLSVADLKSARLVCKLWHVVISEIQILAKKSLALAFKGDASLMKIKYSTLVPKKTGKYWIFAPRLFRKKIPIHGTTFRIQNSVPFLVIDWLHFFKAKNITSLEIDFSSLSVDMLISCISDCFTKLESLTLTGDSFIPDPQPLSGKMNKLLKPTLKNLKTLTINVTHPWIYVIIGPEDIMPVPNFLTTPFLNCLVTLNIKVTDSGSAVIDHKGHFQTIFKSVSFILKNNAKTLKNVSLVTYDIVNDRAYQFYLTYPDLTAFPAASEAPSEHQNFLFNCFLEEMKASGWIDFGLQLRQLTLAFRLVNIKRNSIVDDILKPFLKSQTSLQEISVSQIFIQNREYFNEVFGRFFMHCKCHFVEVHNVKPDNELDNELQGPLQFYFTQNNLELVFPFYREFKEEQAYIRKRSNAQDSHYNWDIISQLVTPTIKWIVRFSSWKSLQTVGFFKTYINVLTKIKIENGVVPQKEKLVITDEDLQTIFRSGKMLTEIYFQHCNLFGITDYGLTGISIEARNRMFRARHIVPETSDYIGVPISNLKKLRSIQIGDAGPGISDFSIRFGFKGMAKMDSFKMQFVHYTTARVPPLVFDFPCTRDLTQFPKLQYETYEKTKL